MSILTGPALCSGSSLYGAAVQENVRYVARHDFRDQYARAEKSRPTNTFRRSLRSQMPLRRKP